jgi:GTP-binding protein
VARPVVAIIGRPNVGKSTLLNRLIGARKAIVEDLPGTTLDRIHAEVSWEGRKFTLVDCGGLEVRPGSPVRKQVRYQIEKAIAEADLLVFLVDAQTGLTAEDLETADVIRRSSKTVILAVNKIDNRKHEAELLQFYELGLGDPVPLSAYHGKGIDTLLDRIIEQLPQLPPASEEPEGMKIAVVGRPNVGKSSLVNMLLGEDRVIVDEVPGTTRDSIDTLLTYKGQRVVLIDTAGIRRRGRVEQGIEKYSLDRTMNAVQRADVVLLLVDALEGITAQDLHILGFAHKVFKGAILVVNKWDLAQSTDMDAWRHVVKRKIRFMPYIEVLFISAKTGYGVKRILPAARMIFEERLKILPAELLSDLVREVAAAQGTPRKGTKRLKVYGVSQTAVNPPTMVFEVNDARLVHFSYRRYLENKIRQLFGFRGTPIRLLFRNRVKEKSKKE